MPYAFVFYPEPSSAPFTITPDSGGTYTSVPYVHSSGRAGQVAYVADGTPDNQGSVLRINADGYEPFEARGFLRVYTEGSTARLELDDYKLKPAAVQPGPTPPPSGPVNPLDVINRVYNETQPQLWTLAGCGKFTEDCCRALHTESSPYWGHIRKNPGQNQFNGHAVDAIMLALNIPGTAAGIYDIIYSSVSSEAKPVFNMAGPPEYDLWYYPEASAAGREAGEPMLVISLRPPHRSIV